MNSMHESVIEIFILRVRWSKLFLPFFQEPLVFDQDFEYALFLFSFDHGSGQLWDWHTLSWRQRLNVEIIRQLFRRVIQRKIEQPGREVDPSPVVWQPKQ